MKKRSRWIAGITAHVLIPLVVLTTAFSLTVENISLDRITSESHTVVYGTVESSYSQWEERAIYTYTTIRVRESLKGDNSATITIKQMGGQVGDIGQEVSGTPKLRRNEDVVLFLTRWKDNYWIHSIALGKFSVINEDNRAVAFNDLNNIGIIDPVTKREITESNKKSNHIPLRSFLTEVRGFITNARKH